jgi:hypothetical protein
LLIAPCASPSVGMRLQRERSVGKRTLPPCVDGKGAAVCPRAHHFDDLLIFVQRRHADLAKSAAQATVHQQQE